MCITSKSAEDETAQIKKKLYDLGFEVGLKRHFQIGWVLREYNDLIIKARKLGIKSPDSYYADGKTTGKASKDTGIETNKTSEKPDVFVKKVDASDIMEGFDDDMEEIGTRLPQKKPSLNEIPNLIKKSKASEIPGFLKGIL